MPHMIPYIKFNGNCEEALHYYREKLQGEITSLSRYEESPENLPDIYLNKVKHAEFCFGANGFMSADCVPDTVIIRGNSIQFSVTCQNYEELTTYFNSLAADGKVLVPINQMFWGTAFGLLEDKYGIQWRFAYFLNQGN